MAKTPAQKSTLKAPVKKSVTQPKASGPSIEKVAETILSKLKSLNLDLQLQSELEWCLGSYRHDGNPIGLYQMAERAIPLFKAEQAKKTKGITAKTIGEIEKALQNR